MTGDVTRILRDAYDRRVEERAARPPPAWETAERDNVLTRLQQGQEATSLLEVGAATGSDAAFFKPHGFDVVCVDLSPRMVERCGADRPGRRESAVRKAATPARLVFAAAPGLLRRAAAAQEERAASSR